MSNTTIPNQSAERDFKINLPVQVNQTHKIVLATTSMNFYDDEIEGSLTCGGSTVLINVNGGTQYELSLKDVLELIKKEHLS